MSVTATSNAVARDENDVHPLIEKVRHSTVPIAQLIGFHIDEITHGHAVATFHSVLSTPIPWALCTEACCAT